MALANIAEMLYNEGLKVLMVDFDLEAPGLEQYFYKKEEPKRHEAQRTRGVIDLLLSYKNLRSLPPVNLPTDDTVSEPTARKRNEESQEKTGASEVTGQNENKFPYPVEPLTNFMFHIYPKNANGGQLSLLPAGRRAGPEQAIEAGAASAADAAAGGAIGGEDMAAPDQGNRNEAQSPSDQRRKDEFTLYADRVRSFAWDDFYINWNGEQFFDWFREKAVDFADVVLIDSRTGVAEMSGVCTYQLADAVVMFVAPNNQNIYGTRRVASSLINPSLVSEGRKGRELSLMLVPTRVDVSSEKFFVDDFAGRFRTIADTLNSKKLTFDEDPFVDLRIPYVSYYSFVDEIAAEDPDSPVAVELVKAYKKICAKLAQLEPVGSKLRAKFEVKATDEPVTADRQNKIAERAYLRLKSEAQERAPRILKRLVRLSQRGENARDTPLRVSLEEFNSVATEAEIKELADVGLVVFETDTGTEETLIRISDEYFVQNWRRLRAWLDEDRDFLLWRQSLKTKLNEWKITDDNSALLSGGSLTKAKAWHKERVVDLNLDEWLYIYQSTRYQKKRRFVQYAAAGMVLLLILLAVFLIWRNEKRRRQEDLDRQNQELAKNIEVAKSANEAGITAFEKGDFDSALTAFTRAIEKSPDFPQAYLSRAIVYVERGDEAKAQRDFDQAIKLKADFVEAYAARGKFYIGLNKLDEAQVDLDRAISLKADYAPAYYYRANLATLRSNYVDAVSYSTRAIELKPDYGDAYFTRARVYNYEKDNTKAVSDLQRAIEYATSPRRETVARRLLENLVGPQRARALAPMKVHAAPLVFIQYNDAKDADRIKALQKRLSDGYNTEGIEVRSEPTQGEVRYYYEEDKPNADQIRTIVNKSLAETRINLTVQLVFLSDVNRSVKRGTIEIWMPPLTSKQTRAGAQR
ncbi:MAG: hypothetical protein QOH70_2046 [Blastocatellia bacterium]|jgi:tetratricopeptide (TPR) repeat protein/MinD-like ATPase involved in chromosome partitioning or flagellar assembly|nr:hypothetical protein [Blastocatellia bacterium]